VIHEVYRQQKEMCNEKKRNIPYRMAGISQPHVRSIKHGKAAANWEFGAKISIWMLEC